MFQPIELHRLSIAIAGAVGLFLVGAIFFGFADLRNPAAYVGLIVGILVFVRLFPTSAEERLWDQFHSRFPRISKELRTEDPLGGYLKLDGNSLGLARLSLGEHSVVATRAFLERTVGRTVEIPWAFVSEIQIGLNGAEFAVSIDTESSSEAESHVLSLLWKQESEELRQALLLRLPDTHRGTILDRLLS